MSQLFGATDLVVPFEKLRMSDVEAVGGKNASLGEMISQLPTGVKVPTGFATTAHAFRQFGAALFRRVQLCLRGDIAQRTDPHGPVAEHGRRHRHL